MTRRPFARVAVAATRALFAPAPRLVLILVFAPAPARAAVDLRLLDERRVDFDVVLRLLAEPPDVEREGLVALGPDELLDERLTVLRELVARRRLVLLELDDDEPVRHADRALHDVAVLAREREVDDARRGVGREGP